MNERDPSVSDTATLVIVSRALSGLYQGAPVDIGLPVSIRNNSRVFRAAIGTSPASFAAIKVCVEPGTGSPDATTAKEQYVALERVYRALTRGNPRYAVPEPLHRLDEFGAFAMAWAEGESLTRKMNRFSFYRGGRGWFEDVGAWLGNFHHAGPLRRQPVDMGDRLAVIDAISMSPLPDKVFANGISQLKKTASTSIEVNTHFSWLHGDCKTDNFILGDKCIYGIDIGLRHENPVEYDLAQFLNNLGLLLSGPKYFHLTGLQTRLEAAFLFGYRRVGPSYSPTALNWLRLNFLLAFWHAEIGKRKPSLRRWTLNKLFARHVNRLTLDGAKHE